MAKKTGDAKDSDVIINLKDVAKHYYMGDETIKKLVTLTNEVFEQNKIVAERRPSLGSCSHVPKAIILAAGVGSRCPTRNRSRRCRQ